MDLKVAQTEDLTFTKFDQLWNQERLNRLDFYVSDLERMLRVSDMLPVPHAQLWPEFENAGMNARVAFKSTSEVADNVSRSSISSFRIFTIRTIPNGFCK